MKVGDACPECGIPLVASGVHFENSYPVVGTRCPNVGMHGAVPEETPVPEHHSHEGVTYEGREPAEVEK